MNKLWYAVVVVGIVVLVLILSQAGGENNDKDEDKKVEKGEFEVTITNVSQDQTLSPGVFVVHNEEFELNYDGRISPEALEPLAEYGENEQFISFVRDQVGVFDVYPIEEPLTPGESYVFAIDLDEKNQDEAHLSGVQMAVSSNDGLALIDSVKLYVVGEPITLTVDAVNYDSGTEENIELGSGFAGGQPDVKRGEENIDNGTPTEPQEEFRVHPQLTETIMEVAIRSLN